MKVRISITDFIPNHGKYPTGIVDTTGNVLCCGDAVEDKRGGKHLVAYRYGSFCLKQPNTMHTLSLKDGQVTKIAEVWAAQDYLIIGEDTEVFIQQLQREHATPPQP